MYATIFRVLLRRPWLVPAALGMAWATRRRNWYRRPPFLPIPSAQYVRWRLETAYGDAGIRPPTDEIARYLAWSRRVRRRM